MTPKLGAKRLKGMMAKADAKAEGNLSVSSSACMAAALLSLLIRAAVGLWGFSGKGKPPMFGDFEAQRHWMEITTALPIGEWYFHGQDNDLLYWGLDYPPLTAYVSYAFGMLAKMVLPDLVELHSSRGFETVEGKNFMRLSVLLCDAIVFIPAVISLTRISMKAKATSKNDTLILLVALLAPPLMLIDNGHFQYNGVCIGLSLWAIVMLLEGRDGMASVLFSLALNFKQMGLYYAPVFFFALLGNCFRKETYALGFLHLCKVGMSVIFTFVSMWFPFCLFHSADTTCSESMLQVLHRMFPFARGIFEDKVANFWYVSSVVFDFRGSIAQPVLVKLALMMTLALLLPTATALFRRRQLSHESLTLSLVTSSLAFFLCSFQVHEKSILLSTVPAAMYFTSDPLFVTWFQILGSFSMFPLLQKDGQIVPYFLLHLMFGALVLKYFDVLPEDKFKSADTGYERWIPMLKNAFVITSLAGMCVLHIGVAFADPPPRYPDLYPALFAIYGFLNLAVAYLYTVSSLWMLPESK